MEADDKVINLVHLTYRANNYEALVKEFEFSRATMEAHWNSGYRDAQVTLTNPEIFKLPDRKQGFRIFDMRSLSWLSPIGIPPINSSAAGPNHLCDKARILARRDRSGTIP